MATTTNFGWETPDDTDLVKDGAAAIRTALNGVDTSFADLKGGTTGQVLSKASGTDLDFTWVAQDDSNAIQNAIVDAKGDLIAATAADTPARLAVGTNGQVLTADSTASTGLKWATVSPAGMSFIATSDFTSSSAVNINNCFTSTYSNYRVIVTLTGSTDMDVTCRLRVGGADSSSALYSNRRVALAAGYSTTASTTGTSMNFTVGRATNSSIAAYDFTNPQATKQTGILGQSFEPSGIFDINGCIYTATTSFDGFSLITSSGTITGTVTIFGYAKS